MNSFNSFFGLELSISLDPIRAAENPRFIIDLICPVFSIPLSATEIIFLGNSLDNCLNLSKLISSVLRFLQLTPHKI